MICRINKTALFATGWFLAMMMSSVGLLPRFQTFIQIWQIELPIAILLALCCGFWVIRTPKLPNVSRDEFWFVIMPIGAFIAWSFLSAFWADSWKSAIHHALLWTMYLIFYLIVRGMVETKKGTRDLVIAVIGSLTVYSIAAIAGCESE